MFVGGVVWRVYKAGARFTLDKFSAAEPPCITPLANPGVGVKTNTVITTRKPQHRAFNTSMALFGTGCEII